GDRTRTVAGADRGETGRARSGGRTAGRSGEPGDDALGSRSRTYSRPKRPPHHAAAVFILPVSATQAIVLQISSFPYLRRVRALVITITYGFRPCSVSVEVTPSLSPGGQSVNK